MSSSYNLFDRRKAIIQLLKELMIDYSISPGTIHNLQENYQYWFLTNGFPLYSVLPHLEISIVMRKREGEAVFCIYFYKDTANFVCYIYYRFRVIIKINITTKMCI